MLINPGSVAAAMAVWLLLIALGLLAVMLVIMATVAMRRSDAFSTVGSGASEDADRHGGPIRAARRRALAAIGAGAAVLVLGMLCNGMFLRYGLDLALLPGVAACVAMIVIALPLSADGPGHISSSAPVSGGGTEGGSRVASLTPRGPWTYARRYVLAQPIIVAVLLAVYLTFTACTATADGESAGRSIRLVTSGDFGAVTAEASPYPGAYYAVPLIGVTVLLLALTCVALHRIAAEPIAADPRDAVGDRLGRIALTKFVTFLSSGTMLGYAAGVLFFAGNATRLIGANLVANLGVGGEADANNAYSTLGGLQMCAGGGLAVLAVIYLALAVTSLTRLRTGMRGETR